MSEDTDTNLMDTAPGGEAHLQFTSMKSADTTFRYESVNTYHKPHAKEEEQFNGKDLLASRAASCILT